MRRREFVMGFCAVATWPIAARAEQIKTYRVGLLASRPVGEGEERRKAIKVATFNLKLGLVTHSPKASKR